MKQVYMGLRPSYTAIKKRSEWRQLELLAVIVLSMWVLSVQTLKAQCNAGSFVPPTFLHTTPNGTVMSFIQEPDGKYTISGLFSGTNIEDMARLNSDGSIDNSFTSPPFGGYPDANRLRRAIRLPDGKYMVGGHFTTPVKHVARLNSDGTIDNTFTPPSSTFHNFGAYVTTVVPLPNGQYLVGGIFSQPKESIMRLNSDGSLDESFGYVGIPGPTTPNRVHNGVLDIEVLSNGQILIATGNGVDLLNADGTRDLTFTNILFNNPPASIIQSIDVQPNGKIIASGGFTSVANRVMRLNSDGTLDTSFTPSSEITGVVFETQLLSDGKIIIGGGFNPYVMRLNSDGSRDNTLDVPAIGGNLGGLLTVRDIQELPNGFYMAAGRFSMPRSCIAILCTSSASLGGVSNAYCAGQAAVLSYSADISYTAGNTFSVQLSDANGSFSSPITIGSLSSTATSGNINTSIPANISFGTGYRMRIVSTAPAITGADNGTNITLGIETPTLSAGSPSAACDGTVAISSTGSYSSYTWSAGGTASSVSVSANGTYTLTVTNANGCTATASATVSSIIPCCTAPAQAGVIAGAQTLCPNATAATLTSTTAASGGVGTLEYRWQRSTVSASAGFTDIPSSNSPTYAPGVLNTTTWFRRLGGVSCLTNWAAAPASNVVQITVQDITPPTISCLPASVVFNGQSSVNLNVNDLASASDNCGLQSVVTSQPSVACAQLGQTVAVTVTATDNSGNTASCISQVTVSGLPCDWRQLPDGVNCTNGNIVSFNTGNQSFTLNSTNCHTPMAPHTVDGFAFAQRTLCGDGSLQAQVVSIDGLGWGGIAMRESNAAGAKKVHLLTNRITQHRREVRTATNAQVVPQVWLGQQRYWLRLVRTGNDIVGSISANGSQWQQVMAAKVSMNSCIEIGLITHHSNATGNVTTVFSDVAVTGSVGNALQQQAAGDVATEQVTTYSGSLFPNPTTGEVFADLSQLGDEQIQLDVYDQLGRCLHTQQLIPAEAPRQRIQLPDLPAGMYYIHFKTKDYAMQTARLVVQRP